MASGYCVGQHRFRPFLLLQKLLLDRARLYFEGVEAGWGDVGSHVYSVQDLTAA